MKSYSVKSNAKRFARGLAAKHPGTLEAVEPVETETGSGEWWPVVRIACIVCTAAARSRILKDVGDVAVVQWKGEAVDGQVGDASGLKAAFDAVPPVTEGDLEPVTAPAEPLVFSEETIASRPELSRLDIVKAAASLPPRKESSREEIEARRAERRRRIDAEKAAGTRTPTGVKVKINKTNVILDLVKRPNGATQTELETATGWQRHTLRGYIAGTLRKRLAPVGKDIECRRAKGEETRYVLAEAKGGDA